MDFLITLWTAEHPYAAEMHAIGMALQGALAVRNGPNRNKDLPWFHAFVASVVKAFAGGLFGTLWMAQPTSMLSNDLTMGSCIIAFVLVNYTPFDIGYRILNTLPFTLVITTFAQLFRAHGLMRYVTLCFETFKNKPSIYYPIPVFGPIIYGTLLGNMGGFLAAGFEGYIKNGMPFNFQYGLFCSAFFHFYLNDTTGIIGNFLRNTILMGSSFGMDRRTFAVTFVAAFVHIVGILQLPEFLGPKFSPFELDTVAPAITGASTTTPAPKAASKDDKKTKTS